MSVSLLQDQNPHFKSAVQYDSLAFPEKPWDKNYLKSIFGDLNLVENIYWGLNEDLNSNMQYIINLIIKCHIKLI